MPYPVCLCYQLLSSGEHVHHCSNKLVRDVFGHFSVLDQRCFSWQRQNILFGVEITNKHDIVGKVVNGLK